MDEKKDKDGKLPVRYWRRPREPMAFGGMPWEFDKIFDDFRAGLEDFFKTGTWDLPEAALAISKRPPIDIEDSGKELIVKAEVPGIPKDKLEISVSQDSIEISGETAEEREEKKKGYYLRERGYARIYRTLPLPSEVLPEKAEASLNHGVLEVRIPKKVPTPEPKKHKLTVK